MKTFTKQAFALICLSSSLISGAALAKTSTAQGGVIHFVGAIVEDPCNISTNSQHISMSCYRSGQMKTSNISYQQAAYSKSMNNDAASISLRYLNPQKTLGIVTVDYK